MTVLKYWDQASGTYKAVSGPPGPQGLAGPTSVSANANNLSSLGSDGLLYTPSNDVGRNKLHNSMFRVWQRGTGAIGSTVGTVVYTADRWLIVAGATGDSITAQRVAHSDANRAAIGDEAAEYFVSIAATGGSGATNICNFSTRLESVRALAGKTVTVSFWWWTSTTGLKLGVSLSQIFGTGGSPSTIVSVPGQIVTAPDTLLHRYSVTITLPSLSGKTLGTNGDDFTQLAFTLSNGGVAGYPAVGAQSGTFNLWGMQLEIGTQATPLEKLDVAVELMECKRFYQIGNMIAAFWQAAATTALTSTMLPVPMRAAPALTPTWSNANVTSPSMGAYGNHTVYAQGNATATGTTLISLSFTASADL